MRERTLMAVAAAAVVLMGCSQVRVEPPSGRQERDVVFLRTADAISLVEPGDRSSMITLPGGVASTDWSTVVRAVPGEGRTDVVAIDARSGERLWSRDAPGTLEVKVASNRGTLAALGAPREGAGYPEGRSTTTLVIVGQNSSRPTTIELRGNYEPEAFSTDGLSLFVVQYLPPRAPTHYRVRRLDLDTGRVTGVFTVDAELQEAMRGTARIQAASSDGRRLYTLYTIDGRDGVRRAFVHVLSLDELWAHCVDLPAPFGNARERGIALAVAPDDRRLYVADAAGGTVAEIDTQALTVTRTAQIQVEGRGGAAHAAVSRDGTLYLGRGTRLLAVTAPQITAEGSWDLDGRISGIQAGANGRVYVGLADAIVPLDTTRGTLREPLEADDLGRIDQLGTSTRALEPERENLQCAC